jgi:hypothetical protein
VLLELVRYCGQLRRQPFRLLGRRSRTYRQSDKAAQDFGHLLGFGLAITQTWMMLERRRGRGLWHQHGPEQYRRPLAF